MEHNRRQEIIDASILLFTERGFDLTSMMDIAKEVGITKSTLYFYFDSKSQLVNEVYRYCHNLDVEACKVGMDNEKDALAKLCRRFKNIIDYCVSHPKEVHIEHLYAESPAYGDIYIGMDDDFYKDVEIIIRDGIKEGTIKDFPVWILCNSFYGLARQLYQTFNEEPDTWNAENEKICYELLISLFKK